VRTIRVSERDLMFALTNRLPGTGHYLDTATGEVVPLFAYNRDKVLELVRGEPGRYLRLAPQSGAEGFRIMQEFQRTVSRPDLREKLAAALSGERAFARFREVVAGVPAEKRRWHQFRATMTVAGLREKLRAQNVELELAPEPEPPASIDQPV
jgi:hypothetical protein